MINKINSIFLIVFLSIFLTLQAFSLYLPFQNTSIQTLNSLLGSLDTFSQEADQEIEEENLPKSGFNSTFLPNNTLPNYSINFNCNYVDGPNKIIEFYYVNRTNFRINLDRSTIRVGSLDIDPYSLRDENKIKELSDNGISIIQTHSNSNLYVRENNGVFEYKRFNNFNDLEAINQQIKSEFESNLNTTLKPDYFTPAYNNGPIDYLELGQKQAMSLRVPKDKVVVWTAGVNYTDEQRLLIANQKGLSAEDSSIPTKSNKTTTASNNNIKKCSSPKVADDALKASDYETKEEIPTSQEIASNLESITSTDITINKDISNTKSDVEVENKELNGDQTLLQSPIQSTNILGLSQELSLNSFNFNQDLTSENIQKSDLIENQTFNLLTPQAYQNSIFIKNLASGLYLTKNGNSVNLSPKDDSNKVNQTFNYTIDNFITNNGQCLNKLFDILYFGDCGTNR
jgi:hypothetical protein